MGAVAVSRTLRPGSSPCPPAYRRRNPRATSLYQLLEVHYETVKGLWEERFERRYGFWRGPYDAAVAKYLDCGLFESGFARVRCTISIPKMLRLYFLHHRELLGELARLAYETVREMMVAAVEEPHARPGMVAVIQTFGSSLKWNPHLHAIVSRSLKP
jgi:Putative transposase